MSYTVVETKIYSSSVHAVYLSVSILTKNTCTFVHVDHLDKSNHVECSSRNRPIYLLMHISFTLDLIYKV